MSSRRWGFSVIWQPNFEHPSSLRKLGLRVRFARNKKKSFFFRAALAGSMLLACWLLLVWMLSSEAVISLRGCQKSFWPLVLQSSFPHHGARAFLWSFGAIHWGKKVQKIRKITNGRPRKETPRGNTRRNQQATQQNCKFCYVRRCNPAEQSDQKGRFFA